MPPSAVKAPPNKTSTDSWFGAPDGIDSELIQEALAARSSSFAASAEQATAPYFFRVYRAFLSARAILALALLGLLGLMQLIGAMPPAWVKWMALSYAGLTCLVWWWPSQRRPSLAPQSSLRPRQTLGSIGVDLVFFSALHQLSEVSVNTQALLVLPVLMAGVLMPRLMALGTAALASINLLVAVSLQGGPAQLTLMTQAGLTGIGLFAIAILSNELATRLTREERSARGSLELARQQAELNRLVLDEMSEGVMVIDRRGRVRAANPASRRLLSAHGSTPAAPFPLRGVPAWQPLIDAVESAIHHPLQAEGGQEVRLRFDDQTQRELRLRLRFTRSPARPQLDAPREDMCVMLLEDLRTVRARQRQDKLAAMGRMSAGIAHEIRNPLAAIAQANALLAEDLKQEGPQRLTQMIDANVDRLKHIVEDILTVAPGVRPPAPAIDLIETVVALCNEWRSTHHLPGGEQGLLDIDFSGCHTTAAPPLLRVRFEPEHLQRVLVNLLDNALRYNSTEPGAILLSLRWLPSINPEGLLMLSVSNDGAPIDADAERALFEPFFSTSSRGTGLGLYISRELCERHGASIDYRQHPTGIRHRNEFFITMPVAPAAHAPLTA